MIYLDVKCSVDEDEMTFDRCWQLTSRDWRIRIDLVGAQHATNLPNDLSESDILRASLTIVVYQDVV